MASQTLESRPSAAERAGRCLLRQVGLHPEDKRRPISTSQGRGRYA